MTILIPFVRLPFYALFLSPLTLIPFHLAFRAWLVLQIAVFISVLWWAKRRWGAEALIFGAMFLPAALGIASGQDCVFMLAIVAGIVGLHDRRREGAAGVVLALGLIKFHLFVMWPILLLVQKRWRMLVASFLGVCVEILFSFLLVGSGGLGDYAALLSNRSIEMLSPSRELMVNVHSLLLNFGADYLALHIAFVLIIAGVAVVSAHAARFGNLVVASCIASLLVSLTSMGTMRHCCSPGSTLCCSSRAHGPAKLRQCFSLRRCLTYSTSPVLPGARPRRLP